MRDIYIIYSKYYDFDSDSVTIGGVQTYITNLCNICLNLEMKPHIVQIGNSDKRGYFRDVEIIQLEAENVGLLEKAFTEKLLPSLNQHEDIFLFATDNIIFKKIKFKKSIAIQHGIHWDVFSNNPQSRIRVLISRARRAHYQLKLLENVNRLVCVDYNFLNWLRTQVDTPLNGIEVIPNFTEIMSECRKPDGRINLIFARRFFHYRGTRIFTKAIKRILDEKLNVFVTIAGSGEDEKWMRAELSGYENVEFTTYKSQDSLQVHTNMHIAVVPTLGSEGTSLSLLEAMSTQCAVICTNVGGLTNIVIDGYNGLMISPDEEELYASIKELVKNKELREKLARKGYETVSEAFSFEKWERKWQKVISSIEKM